VFCHNYYARDTTDLRDHKNVKHTKMQV